MGCIHMNSMGQAMSEEWARPEIGAWGWGHSEWQDNFYPDDLPTDWRLTYYSNEFPLVLVPVADWVHMSASQVVNWIEDVNEEFQFILELPASGESMYQPGILEECVSAFSDALIAGVIDLSSGELPAEGVLQEICHRCASILPVHVNLPTGKLAQTVQDMLEPYQVSYCWRHDLPDVSRVNTDLQIGIVTSHQQQVMPLPELRQHLEQFRSVSPAAKRTILLFKGSPPCIDDMNNANVIADLL